jgi:SnoaL-like polyketide cyclase
MLSDLHFETTRVIQQDSIIVAEFLYRGTNTGRLTTPDGTVIPATGRTMTIPSVILLDVRDGLIVALRAYYDQRDGLAQLGLMPVADQHPRPNPPEIQPPGGAPPLYPRSTTTADLLETWPTHAEFVARPDTRIREDGLDVGVGVSNPHGGGASARCR